MARDNSKDIGHVSSHQDMQLYSIPTKEAPSVMARCAVVDLTTATVAAIVAVGQNPLRLAVTPDGKFVYVPNEVSGTVSVIDTETLGVVATIPVGVQPHAVAFAH